MELSLYRWGIYDTSRGEFLALYAWGRLRSLKFGKYQSGVGEERPIPSSHRERGYSLWANRGKFDNLSLRHLPISFFCTARMPVKLEILLGCLSVWSLNYKSITLGDFYLCSCLIALVLIQSYHSSLLLGTTTMMTCIENTPASVTVWDG